MADPNPKSLFRSKTFWAAVLQLSALLALYFGGEEQYIKWVALIGPPLTIILRLVTGEPVGLPPLPSLKGGTKALLLTGGLASLVGCASSANSLQDVIEASINSNRPIGVRVDHTEFWINGPNALTGSPFGFGYQSTTVTYGRGQAGEGVAQTIATEASENVTIPGGEAGVAAAEAGLGRGMNITTEPTALEPGERLTGPLTTHERRFEDDPYREPETTNTEDDEPAGTDAE